MTQNLLNVFTKRALQLNRLKSNLVTITRNHQNHPGHKPRPLAIPVKHELPDTYVDEPEYPPVKPKYPPGYWSDKTDPKLAWHYYDEGVKMHSLKTIQERLSVMAYLNIQPTIDDVNITRLRHYPLFLLPALPAAARSLEFYQYITKTHFNILTENISSVFNDNCKDIDNNLYEAIKESVINSILSNLLHKRDYVDNLADSYIDKDAFVADEIRFENKLNKDNEKGFNTFNDILNSITALLATNDKYSHLRNAQYARNVDIQSYWKRCGYEKAKPRGAIKPDPDVIRYQFRDKASYQIKTSMPLKPLKKFEDINYNELKVPECQYNPSVYKVFADHTLPMQVPGHWYGEEREFNYLTVYNMTKLAITKRRYGDEEVLPALHAMAVAVGHAELTAQAYYLGFSMWKDLTYPLMGQFMFTNGQDFSFSKYQLNTVQLWNNAVPMKNMCYFTNPERLYEFNEDRTIKSFNDNLLKRIISVLIEKPINNENEIVENYSPIDYMIGGTALRPYLSIQDFEKQLSMRRQLLALSLYELVKYDRPATYLNINLDNISKHEKPKFHHNYNKITFTFRDIVRDYYPLEYQGYELVKISLKTSQVFRPKFWDLLDPVYEWATIPPPHTNNVKRNIDLPKY